MSRVLLRAVSLACGVATLAAPGTGASSDPVTGAGLHLTAPSPLLEPADDGRRVVPRIPGFGLSSRPGEPMLPLKVYLVAIPEGSVPELRITQARSEALGRLDIAPAPRLRVPARGEDGRPAPPGQAENEFRPDAQIYGRDHEFPETPVRLGATGYLREQRFVEVLFTPVAYNPARREARYFPEVRAEVRFTAPAGAPLSSPARPFRPDPLFEETYRQSLVNYEQGKQFRATARTNESGIQGAGPASSLDADVAVPASAGTSRYKILVSRDGIYRLDYAYLQTHAPDLLALDPRTLSLSAEGIEVPISIRDAAGASGESDGRFDPPDFLEFYGRSKIEPPTVLNHDFGTIVSDIYQANDFTDTQIYWLTSSGAAGSHPRIATADGAPVSPSFPVASDFEERAIWEENNIYTPLGDAEPFFSMPSLLAGSAQAQRDLILPLPGLAPLSTNADVTIRLRGATDLPESPDHRTRGWLNDNSAGGVDFTWDGEVIHERVFTESQSNLTDPTTIHLSAPGIPGVSVDRQYPDTVTIRYRRLFEAVQDILVFTYPNQDTRFQVNGFSGASPTIYEITRTLPGGGEADAVRITGATVSGSPATTYTFEVPRDGSASAPAVRSFVVAGPTGIGRPDAMQPAADPLLRDPTNAADLIVIAARDTVDQSPGGSLDSLLAHRLAAQGLTSQIVFADQIYDEFAYGLRDVNAIRSFLSYAFDNWRGTSGTARPPSFVLLAGDATPDYKNTLQRSDWVDQVPTPIMFHANSILGYYSSDNWLAAFRGTDQVPDVFLGRISTRSAAASAAVFDKIRRYEQAPPPGLWKGRGILIAGDGKVAGEAEAFEAIQEELRTSYFSVAPYSSPDPPLYFSRPPWNSADIAGFKSAFLDELQRGAAVLSVVDHGSFATWSPAGFFTTEDAGALTNDGPLPFLVTVNCLTGGFHYLIGSGSMGEGMVNNPAGGAIAALAPSGLSSLFVGRPVIDYLFAPLLGPTKERLLGAAANLLRAGLWGQGSVLDMQSYTLLGDPATVLATPAPPPPLGITAAAGNAQVQLSWSPPSVPVAGYRIYRSRSAPSGPYAAIACDPVTETSCLDRTVVNANTYYYYAVSLDAEGFEGRASNFNSDCDVGPDCVVARPLNPGPPSVPTGLTSFDPGTGGRLQISWQPNPEQDLKSYALYYGNQQSGPYPTRVNLGPTATSTTLVGLSDGIRYYLALSATNTSGHESPLSAEISDVPHLIQGIAPPRAISDLRITRLGDDLVLAWSRPTVDIYGRPTTVVRYTVYRGAAPGFQPFSAAPIANLNDGSTTSYTDAGAALPSAGNLYYLVMATDANGFSSGVGRELPNGIQNLAVSLPAPGTVRLAWPAVTTDVSGHPTLLDHYEVHMSDRPLARASLGPSTLVMDNVRVVLVDLSAPTSPLFFSVIAVDNRGNRSPF